MEQTGYFGAQRRNPLGLALVISGHVAVLGAIILSPPEFIRDRIIHTSIYEVKQDMPPPPNPTPPKPEPHQKSVIDTPKPLVDPRLTQTVTLTHVDSVFPTLPPQPRVDPTPIPVHEPVVTEAQVDSRGAFQPDYPPAMARNEIDGAAVVRVRIGADGRVKEVQLVSATDPAFYQATERQALRSWRFRPATRDGVAVESWRTMTVRFRMQA